MRLPYAALARRMSPAERRRLAARNPNPTNQLRFSPEGLELI